MSLDEIILTTLHETQHSTKRLQLEVVTILNIVLPSLDQFRWMQQESTQVLGPESATSYTDVLGFQNIGSIAGKKITEPFFLCRETDCHCSILPSFLSSLFFSFFSCS